MDNNINGYSIQQIKLPENKVESIQTPQFSINKNTLPQTSLVTNSIFNSKGLTTNPIFNSNNIGFSSNQVYNAYTNVATKSYVPYINTTSKEDDSERVSRYNTTKTLYTNSRDSTQVNSMLDVLVKGFTEAWVPEEYGGGNTFSLAAAAESFPKAFDEWLHRQYVDPWNYKKLALAVNTLTGFAETVDLLSGVTKAAYPNSWTTAKYDTSGRLDTFAHKVQAAYIWDPEYGRYTIDMDFDFNNDGKRDLFELIADIAFEVISDPINWLTMGITAAAGGMGAASDVLGKTVKTVTKELGGETAEAVAKTTAKEIVEEAAEAATKTVSGEVAEVAAKVTTKEVGEEVAEAAAKEVGPEVAEATAKTTSGIVADISDIAPKTISNEVTGNIVTNTTKKTLQDALNNGDIAFSKFETYVWTKRYFRSVASGSEKAQAGFYKSFSKVIAKKLNKAGVGNLSADQFISFSKALFNGLEQSFTNRVSMDILCTLYKFGDTANTWLNVLGAPHVFGAAKIIKNFPSVGKYVYNRALNFIEPYKNTQGTLDAVTYSTAKSKLKTFFAQMARDANVDLSDTDINKMVDSFYEDSLIHQVDGIINIVGDKKFNDDPEGVVNALSDYIFSITNGRCKTISEYSVEYKSLIDDDTFLIERIYGKENLKANMDYLVNLEKNISTSADTVGSNKLLKTIQEELNDMLDTDITVYTIDTGTLSLKNDIIKYINGDLDTEYVTKNLIDSVLDNIDSTKLPAEQFEDFYNITDSLFRTRYLDEFWSFLEYNYGINSKTIQDPDTIKYIKEIGLTNLIADWISTPEAISNMHLNAFKYDYVIDVFENNPQASDTLFRIILDDDALNLIATPKKTIFDFEETIELSVNSIKSNLKNLYDTNVNIKDAFTKISNNPLIMENAQARSIITSHLENSDNEILELAEFLNKIKGFNSSYTLAERSADLITAYNDYLKVVSRINENSKTVSGIISDLLETYDSDTVIASMYKGDDIAFNTMLNKLVKSKLSFDLGKKIITADDLDTTTKYVKDLLSNYKNFFKDYINELDPSYTSLIDYKDLDIDDIINSYLSKDKIKTFGDLEAAIDSISEEYLDEFYEDMQDIIISRDSVNYFRTYFGNTGIDDSIAFPKETVFLHEDAMDPNPIKDIYVDAGLTGLEISNVRSKLNGILLSYKSSIYDSLNKTKLISTGDEIIIRLRHEMSSQFINLVTGKFADKLYADNAPGQFFDWVINNYSKSNPELSSSFKDIRDLVNNMYQQKQMITIAQKYFKDSTILTSMFESFTQYSELSPERLRDPDIIASLIDKIKINLGYKFYTRSAAIDAYRNEFYDEEFITIAKNLFGEEHYAEALERATKFGHTDPGGDLIAAMLIASKKDPEGYAAVLDMIKDNEGAVWFDIETAMKRFNADGTVMNASKATPITQVALRGVGGTTDGKDIIIRVKGCTDPVHPSAKIIEVASEEELLRLLDDTIKTNNIRYFLGYNCKGFDMEHILYRMELYESNIMNACGQKYNLKETSTLFELFRNRKNTNGLFIYDALESVYRNNGVPILDEDTINNIYAYCELYSKQMEDLGRGRVAAVRPIQLKRLIKDMQDNLDIYLPKSDPNYNQIKEYLSDLSESYRSYNATISNKELHSIYMKDLSKDADKWEQLWEILDPNGNMSFEDFKAQTQKEIGREDFTTMYQLWAPYGDSSTINFEYVYKPVNTTYGDVHLKPSKYLSSDGLLQSELMRNPDADLITDISGNIVQRDISPFLARTRINKDKEIYNLFSNRIRNIDGIYNLVKRNADGSYSKIFKDGNDLFKQTDDLVRYASKDSWLYGINLNAPIYQTEAGRFALWYADFTYQLKYLKNNENVIGDYARALAIKEDAYRFIISGTTSKVFNETSIGKYYNHLSPTSLEEMVDEAGYENLSTLDRIIRYTYITDYLPGSETKTIVRSSMMHKNKMFLEWYQNLISQQRNVVHNTMNDYQATAYRYYSTVSLNNALTNKDLFIADILSSGGSKIFTADLKGRIALTAEDKYYLNALEILVSDPELEAAGIKVIKSSDGWGDNVYEFVLDKTKKITYDYNLDIYTFNGKSYNGFKYEYVSMDGLKPDLHIPGFVDNLKVLEESNEFAYRTTGYANIGWAVHSKNYDNLVYNRLSDAAKQYALDTSELEAMGWFFKPRYSTMNVSPINMRISTINNPGNEIVNICKAYERSLNDIQAKDLFIDYLCNPKTAMNFNKDGFFRGLTDEQIAKCFRDNDDLIVISPTQADNVQGYLLVRLNVRSAKDVAKARQLNASVVNYQIYSTMFDAINNNGDAILRSTPNWLRTVNYITKVGYLASPGTWIRNAIDSNLKAVIDTGDPIGMAENTIKADKLYRSYYKTIELMSNSYDLASNNLNVTYIQKFYQDEGIQQILKSKHALETFDDFMEVHNFITYGPSAGYSNAVKKLLGQQESNVMYWLGSKAISPMGYVESRVRLAEYLTLKKQGFLKSDLFKMVSDTAFDYGIKTETDKFIEYFIPFYNFQKLNFIYWFNKINDNPLAMKVLFKWDAASNYTFDFTPEEYQENQSLRYYIEHGGIHLGDNFVLKLNPSYIDAYNLLCDPVNGITGSMYAPIKNIFKVGKAGLDALFASGIYTDEETAKSHFLAIAKEAFINWENIPWAGILMQRYFEEDSTRNKNKQRLDNELYKKLGAILPDIFGSVNRWNNYKWNEGLPDRTTEPLLYYAEIKRRSKTKEFQDMYNRMKSIENPSEKQRQFLAWIESAYFPYSSEKQKKYFENGYYNKNYPSSQRKTYYYKNYTQYRKQEYPQRNKNYYRSVPTYQNSTFWKVYNQAKAHAYYGWSVRVGSRYLNFYY